MSKQLWQYFYNNCMQKNNKIKHKLLLNIRQIQIYKKLNVNSIC